MTDATDIETRRAERKARLAEQRSAQYARDLEALDAAEEKHGDGMVLRYALPAYMPELPTFLVLRFPTPAEIKRLQSKAARDDQQARLDAGEELAAACLVYPDRETYARVIAKFPAVPAPLSLALLQAAQGKRVEEGKD